MPADEFAYADIELFPGGLLFEADEIFFVNRAGAIAEIRTHPDRERHIALVIQLYISRTSDSQLQCIAEYRHGIIAGAQLNNPGSGALENVSGIALQINI